jgi:hypothetical protein
MERRATATLLALALLAGCVAETPPVPKPQPVKPQPAPAQPLEPPPPEWEDLPATPGDWSYRDDTLKSEAWFGPSGAGASFGVRCDKLRREVGLLRAAAAGGTMNLRTTAGARDIPVSPEPAAPGFVAAALPASDSILDGIAFSRGHFTVDLPGTPMLVAPAWPEPARVIEDCRG